MKPRFLGLIVLAWATLLSGCASPLPHLDPTSGTTAAQRKATLDGLSVAVQNVGRHLRAGTALGVRTDTVCMAGTDDTWTHDGYRSLCSVAVTTAYAVEAPAIPALAGLATKLAPTFWTLASGSFDADEAARKRARVTLKDLNDVVYSGPQQGTMVITVHRSSEPVPGVATTQMIAAGGAYYVRVGGTNWQTAWAGQRSHQRYVVIVSAHADFAKQSQDGGTAMAPSGQSFPELRRQNLRYADRDPFNGDGPGIARDQARVTAALKAVKKPTVVTFRAALLRSGYSTDNVGTTMNAVRLAGVGFAVTAHGGCIFGSSYMGVLTVEVGGFVRDGGCLASYGH